MNKGGLSEQDVRIEVHLVVITMYTIFSIALIAESILMEWATWPIPMIGCAIFMVWFMHVTESMTPEYRMRIYAVIMFVEFFFYGTHATSFFDLAMVMSLAIVMFALAGEMILITLGLFMYFLSLAYQFVTNGPDMFLADKLTFSRTLLHCACVLASAVMSMYLIQRRNKQAEKYDEMIKSMSTANHRIEDFLTNISHELRTPINAVVGITNVMIATEKDKDRKYELNSVLRAGRRLFDQIGDILDYTEIDTGKLTVSEDVYMISSLINDLTNEAIPMSDDDVPELVFDISPNIPSGIVGDGRKIKRILKHLIDNGIKFTARGGIYAKIYAIPKPYGMNLVIEVRDTGCGISEEEMSLITSGYYQSDSSRTRRAGGLGLGLAIVRGFASAMGGFMQIESTYGVGTTVRVSVPQRVDNPEPCMSVEHPARLCSALYLRPEKYTVPEVREYYNEMVTVMVKGLGLTVYRANSFDELQKINNTYHLTHLFVAEEEYKENPSYYETLEREIIVTVIAGPGFEPDPESRVLLIKKPLYPFSLVNVLNSTPEDYAKNKIEEERHMISPGVNVLVVDDEKMNLIVAEGIFKSYRMNVDTATSGIEAISKSEKNHYDIIFMDHMMPQMDGVEAAKRIMQLDTGDEEKTFIVALTANAVSGAREMFLEEGFDEFVPKPVEMSELERVIKKLLPATAITYVTDSGAYAIDETTNLVDDGSGLSRLRVAGVNVASGLRYSRNDEDFYYELLRNFVDEEPDKRERMNRFYDSESWKDYRILVHALKSSSKMIGLDALSEKALQQEEAAKIEDVAYIRMTHEELLEEYGKQAATIKRLCNFEDSNKDEELMEISAADYIEKLENIKETFATFEVDRAEGIIEELEAYKYKNEPLGTMLKSLISFVNDFDLESAGKEADSIIARIKGGDGA